MRRAPLLFCLLALACSDSAGAGSGKHALAVDRPETRAAATLQVSSPSFARNGAIPAAYSAYGAGRAPALAWSAPPAGTKSLAIMVEDPDAMSAKPFVHWMAWNVDPKLTGLAEAVVPAGVRQGRNNRGRASYFGPRPPGSSPHHYHFQVFALDAPLPLPDGAAREQLLAAMDGHVLAKGDLVGLFSGSWKRGKSGT
ncbi:MAG TPA: YbhB/YbcL family Raf kinase inhibitor-like protein [Allosphingosinicella sp.]|nr:YbhB/YbcL family Raf kinase inhibitor-like protein [Allosphingosinicella sp.]